MCCCMMFWVTICAVEITLIQCVSNCMLFIRSRSQCNRMSNDFDFFCCRLLRAQLLVVALSTLVGVAGCECPNSLAILRTMMVFWQLRNRVKVSNSTTDAAIDLMMLHFLQTSPWYGSSFCIGVLFPQKSVLPPKLLPLRLTSMIHRNALFSSCQICGIACWR